MRQSEASDSGPDASRGPGPSADVRIAALRARIATLEDEKAALEAENAQLREQQPDTAPLVHALIESETRYRTILESEPACVKLVDRAGRLLSMNPAGLSMIEADSEMQVRGLEVGQLVCEHDRAAFEALRESVFEGRSGRLEFEMESLKGTRRHMESFAAPLTDESGRIVAQLAVTHDISERKREQKELAAYRERLEALVAARTRELQASRAESRRTERLASLGTLAAGLAHELNNPLGTILLGADLLDLSLDDGTRAEAIDGIRRDVARCSHIVKSMLRFGRGEASEKIPVSLNQIVRAARDNARDVLLRQGVALSLDLTEALPLIDGNETELGQVLLNLIQNAALASPAGEQVIVRTWSDADRVECVIEDFGLGMSETVAAQAFDPFFTTRLAEGGTGLGLSVSHGIVTEHGGQLTIDSLEGRGTVVHLSLPASPAATVA